MLLELGADVNAVDSNGDTAMHGAAYGNFPAIVQLLTDRGADINIWKRQDAAGRTPLFIAEATRRDDRSLRSRPLTCCVVSWWPPACPPTARGRGYRHLRKGARASQDPPKP